MKNKEQTKRYSFIFFIIIRTISFISSLEHKVVISSEVMIFRHSLVGNNNNDKY